MSKWKEFEEKVDKNPAFSLAVFVISIFFWPIAIYILIFRPSLFQSEPFGILVIPIMILYTMILYLIYKKTKNQEKLRDCLVMFSVGILIIVLGMIQTIINFIIKDFEQAILSEVMVFLGIAVYLMTYFTEYKKLTK